MAKFAVVERSGVFYCESCEKYYDDEEVEAAGPLYECGGCGHTFNSTEADTHQCPECNKFAAKVNEQSCPEGCNEELTEVDALKDTEHGGTFFVSLDHLRESYG